jgi:hypothetical protein
MSYRQMIQQNKQTEWNGIFTSRVILLAEIGISLEYLGHTLLLNMPR